MTERPKGVRTPEREGARAVTQRSALMRGVTTTSPISG
jgi:hypothetical protein